MRLLILALAAFSLSLQPVSPAFAEQKVFHLGVAPHTSARVIVEMYQPLRLHLEQALGQPVVIETATDFTEFGRRALRQEYDLAITTGHQARIYQVDAGYIPVLTYKAEFRAVALVAKNSPYRKPADLKGATVLGLSPSSLVTLWGLHWLKGQGLTDQTTVKYVSAADSVTHQVLAGDAGLAFTSLANYQKLTPEQQDTLRIFAQSEPMTGRIYMLGKQRAKLKDAVEKALLGFEKTPEGERYFNQTKLEGYRKLKPKELESMETFAAETRRVLKEQ